MYLETSALLRVYLDGDSALGSELRRRLPGVATSLTWLEADRSIRTAVASGRLAADDASKLRDDLADLAVQCHEVDLDPGSFDRATREFPIEPIRALDALHIGAALFLRDTLDVRTIASCDKRVRANARALGFEVIP